MGYETFPKDGQGHRMLGEQKRTSFAPDGAPPEKGGHGSSQKYPAHPGAEAMKSRRQTHAQKRAPYAKAGGNAQVSASYPPGGSKKWLIKDTKASFSLPPLMSKPPKKI